MLASPLASQPLGICPRSCRHCRASGALRPGGTSHPHSLGVVEAVKPDYSGPNVTGVVPALLGRAPGRVDAGAGRRRPGHRAPGARRSRVGRAATASPTACPSCGRSPAARSRPSCRRPPPPRSPRSPPACRRRGTASPASGSATRRACSTPSAGSSPTAVARPTPSTCRRSGCSADGPSRWSPRPCSAPPGSRPRTCAAPTSTAGRPPPCWSSRCGRSSPAVRRSCTPTTRASTRSRTRTGSTAAFYPAELAATDRLVGDVLDALPDDVALVVTADHGQVQVGPDGWRTLAPLHSLVETYAGDGRFRYLHAKPGRCRRAPRGRGASSRGGGRLGLPTRGAARRRMARPRPGARDLPARRRRRARGPRPGRVHRSRRCRTRPTCSARTGRSPRPRWRCPSWPPAGERAKVAELHPCDSSTGLWTGVWKCLGRSARRWPSRSCTSTCTPSSRCSTAPRASPRSCRTAAADGQPAVGITDHGNMYGVLDFYRAAREADLTPVIGTEAYMVTTSRHDRPRRDEHDIYHLTLLAESTQGYKNLIKVSSGAYLDGFFQKPRVDFDLLEQHHEGLVGTTGCLGGAVSQAILAGDYTLAQQHVERFQSIFGRDSFFVELQDHGLPEQLQVNPQLIKLARDMRAPLLATNDSHYTHRHDAESHDALLCVQTGALQSDPKRFKFDADEFYLKTAAEMRALFADYEEACDNTLLDRRARRRRDRVRQRGAAVVPHAARPRRRLVPARAVHRGGEGALRRVARSRGARAHRVRARRHQDDGLLGLLPHRVGPRALRALARHPGRSGAGERGGVVRRLLPAHRRHRPDQVRPAVRAVPQPGPQADARHRHGLRLALPRRDDQVRGRALRVGPRRADRHLLHHQGAGRGARLRARARLPVRRRRQDRQAHAAADHGPRHAAARVLREGHRPRRRLQDGHRAAHALRGRSRRQARHRRRPRPRGPAPPGRHPRRRGGDHPRSAHRVPADPAQAGGRREASRTRRSSPSTRCTGSKTSACSRWTSWACATSTSSRSRSTSSPRAPAPAPTSTASRSTTAATFELLRRGDTVGVFQLEGGPMRALLRSLAPTEFEDVAALIALYRPGPMAQNWHNEYADRKNGRKPVTYPHADLQEVLEPTYGLMIYQEQLMRVAQRLAGYSLEEADNLRKATGKKIRALIAKERTKFVDGLRRQRPHRRVRREHLRHHRAVRRLLVQQVALVRLRLRHVPDRLAQGELPARVLRRAAHVGQDQQGPDRRLPQRVPADGHRGARPRRQRVGLRLLGARRPDGRRSASACRRCATSARAWSRTSSRRARKAGRSPTSTTSATASTRRCSTSACIESLTKAGAFDSLGHPRQGLRVRARDDHRDRARSSPQRGRGPVRPVLRGRRSRARGGRRPPHRDPRHRVPEVAAAHVREGDARALRERPPDDGRRARAAEVHRLHALRAARQS